MGTTLRSGPRGPTVVAAILLLAPTGFASSQAPASRAEALRFVLAAESAFAERRGPTAGTWTKRVRDERDRFVSAFDWLAANGEGEAALRLASSLGYYWDYEFVEGGRERLERALRMSGALPPSAARARALLYAGVLAFRLRDDAAADARIRESLALARRLGDRQAQSSALSALARNALRLEDHGSVRTHADEAMRIALEIGDRRSAASARHMLAYSAAMAGQLDRADSLYRENLRVGRELGDAGLVATETGNLAYLEFDRANYEAARSGFGEYLRMSQEQGDELGVAESLIGFGMVDVATNQPERGARLLGAAQAAFARLGTTMDPGTQKDFDAAIAAAKAQLSAAALAAAFDAGKGMTMAQAVELARPGAR